MSLRRRIIIEVEDSAFRKHKGDLKIYITESKKGVKELGDTVEKESRRTTKGLRGMVAAVGAFITGTLVRAAARASSVLFEIGSAVGETESKFKTVFDSASDSVDDFIDNFANIAGLTRTQAREFLATTGAITQGMGATRDESAELSKEIVKLAGDLASFNNVSIDDAFGAIRSGLTGETEPLKRFGIILSENATKLEALARTGKKSADDLTNLEKVQARLAIITAGAGKAIGDLERTQDSAANKARALTARLREQREEFAAQLIPAYQDALKFGEQLLDQFEMSGETLGAVFGKNLRTVIFDLVTFADQVKNLVGVVKDLTSEIDLSILGSGSSTRLTFLENITKELGSLLNVFLGIERGFVNIRITSAKLNNLLGSDNEELIAELEARNQELLKRQLDVLQVVEARQKLKKELQAESGGSGGSGDPASDLAKSLQDNLPKASDEVEKFVSKAVKGLKEVRAELVEFIPPDFITAVQGDLRAFQEEVTRLENDFAQGLIGEDDFSNRIDALSRDFISKLGRLRQTILYVSGDLSPELENAFKEAFGAATGGLKDTDEEIKKVQIGLDDIVTSGRALLNLASVFGELSDEVEDFARGVLDATDNLARLQETRRRLGEAGQLGTAAGNLAQLPSVIGIAAGIAQAIGGLFTDQKTSMQELTKALRDNAKSIKNSIADLIASQRIGGSITGDQATGAQAALANFLGLQAGIGPVGSLADLTNGADPQAFADLRSAFDKFLLKIEGLGIDLDFDAIRGNLLANLELGDTLSEAIEKALNDPSLGLAGVIETIGEDLGGFGASVEGALESLRFFSQFLSDDAAEQVDRFVSDLLALDGVPEELREALTDIGAADLSTEEGRERVNQIIAAVAAAIDSGSFDFGGLTPSELDDILSTLQGLADGSASQAGGGATNDFTRSVQIARTITEIQANELIAIQESSLFRLTSIDENIARMVAAMAGAATGGTVLPDVFFQPRDPAGPVVGSINVNGLTEDQVPGLMVMIEDELRREIRGARA